MSRYEKHKLENKELPFIYRESFVDPNNLMSGLSNWHENIELLYIVDGHGMVSDNGNIIPVSAGDVVVINANHLHSLAAKDRTMLFHYLIVDRSFCVANGFDSTQLTFDTKIEDRKFQSLLNAVNAVYRTASEKDYRTLQIRSLVMQLLVLLCCDHSTCAPLTKRAQQSFSYVKQTIDYIRATYDRDLSLEDAATFVGINKCYLSREFHKYTGYSFVAYVNLTRCKRAQQLLLDVRLSISEVGKQCGFESPSYFARSYQRYMGMLPSEYRAQALKTSIELDEF